MTSIFRTILSLVRTPTAYVGRDLQGASDWKCREIIPIYNAPGNRFYEYSTPFGESSLRKSRRVVKYARPHSDPMDQVLYSRGLPAQWQAWLSHTRPEPPTLEELQYDEVRQERLRINIARLKAQDEELRALEVAQNMPFVAAPATRTTDESAAPGTADHPQEAHVAPIEYRTDLPPPPDVQTESWTPKLARRR